MSQVFFHRFGRVQRFFFRLLPSLTFFKGHPCRWLLFQVAHTADFYPGRARRWFFPRLRISLFFFRVARVHRWLPSQVAHIADFFPRSRPLLIFPRLRTSLISFSWSHDSVADFLFGLCLSMTSFSQVAPVTFFFHVALVFVIFFPSSAYRWIFAS